MKTNNSLDNFKEFMNSRDSASLPPIGPDLSEIQKDLVPSARQLALWYSGFSVVGYFASLLVCAQNSFGLSGFAHKVAELLHNLPDPWCPMACGAVFTGVPFILSAIFLTRFQHRYLILKMWWFFASVPIFATIAMLLLPHNLQHHKLAMQMNELGLRPNALSDTAWLSVWAATAILFPYLLELILWRVVAPRKKQKV